MICHVVCLQTVAIVLLKTLQSLINLLSAYYSFSALTLSVASYHWRLLSGVLLVGGCWHEILYRLDALPVTLPAVSKH